jgi:hypothetical protein
MFNMSDVTKIVRPATIELVMLGSTPGLLANESVELESGLGGRIDTNMLEKNVQYSIEVDAKVSGHDPGANTTSTGVGIINKISCHHDGTTLKIDGVGIPSFTGGVADGGLAHPANWAIAASLVSPLGLPEYVAITFSTGAGVTNLTNIVADVTITPGGPVPPV